MNDAEYCDGWKQVRVFAKYTGDQWYPELLAAVVAPLHLAFPDNPMFFSMYVCRLGVDDDGDTEIARLPADFKARDQNVDIHFSVRLRFRGLDALEAMLAGLIDGSAAYWYSESGIPFRPYGLLGDIGGSRFSPVQQDPSRTRRARLVADALKANNLVVLDAVATGPPHVFERNNDPENAPAWSTFISLGHMYNNVWKDPNVQDLGICVTTKNHLGQFVIVRRL